MRTRWLLNLTLLGIILVLGLLAIYEPGLKKPIELPKLTDLEADQIKHLRLARQKDTLDFDKDAQGNWQITAPLNLPANDFRIKSLLKILAVRDYQQLTTKDLKLADLKLESPEIRLSFDQLTLAFGDSSPMNDGKRYVQLSSKPDLVFLLHDDLYYSLTDEPLSFVNLAPLGEKPKLTELQLPDYHLVLQKGTWTLTSPVSDKINSSTDALNALIDNWQHLQAFKVQNYDKTATVLGDIKVTLEGQQQPLHFTIQGRTTDLILARPDKGVQYRVSARQIDDLLQLPTKASPADATATPSTQKENKLEVKKL
jgi:hypothetical protein